MRKATALEHRVRILEGRIASLNPSLTSDFPLADARTEADLAVEYSQRVLKTVRWGSVAVVGASLLLRPTDPSPDLRRSAGHQELDGGGGQDHQAGDQGEDDEVAGAHGSSMIPRRAAPAAIAGVLEGG